MRLIMNCAGMTLFIVNHLNINQIDKGSLFERPLGCRKTFDSLLFHSLTLMIHRVNLL
jgi:hypothetical protein